MTSSQRGTASASVRATASSSTAPKAEVTAISTSSTPIVMAMKDKNHSRDFQPGMKLRKEKMMKRRM